MGFYYESLNTSDILPFPCYKHRLVVANTSFKIATSGLITATYSLESLRLAIYSFQTADIVVLSLKISKSFNENKFFIFIQTF